MCVVCDPVHEPAGRSVSISARVGLVLCCGLAVARGLSGLGGGGVFAGVASLPDAPNAPGLIPGGVGSAGSLGSLGSSGPGGALLCPPGREAASRGDEYQPDLEDELLWHRLRKAVPDLDGWDGWPRTPVSEQGIDATAPELSLPSPAEGIHEGRDDVVLSAPVPRAPRSVLSVLRSRPCGLAALVGLLVSLVALGFEFAYLRSLANPTGADIVRNAAYGAWVVAWMMLATMAVRTLRLRDLVRFWLVGFFAATGIVAVVGVGITSVTESGLLRTAIVIPIVEELAKALLLAGFLLVAVRRRKREPSITDLVIVGFAIGAAFGVHEDALWVRVSAEGFGSGMWGTLFPVYRWDPFVVVMGHAGWTALAGLGLGLAWHWRRHRWAWVAAAAPLALAILDHVSINYVIIEARGREGVGWTLRELVGHGRLPAQILLAGFALALVLDWLALRRRLAPNPLPPWSTFAGIRSRLGALPGWSTRVIGGIVILGERRARLGARYAEARVASPLPPMAVGSQDAEPD